MMKLILLSFFIPSLLFAEYIGGASKTLGLTCSNGQVPEWNAGGFTQCLTAAGSGTVTSVGVNTDTTTASIFANATNAITGSPVTAAGNMTLTLSTQSANKVLSGPTTGAAAAPTFRSLVGADLPTFTGDVTNSGAAMTVAKINGASVSGVTGSGGTLVEQTSPSITSPTVTGASTSVKKGNCEITPNESDIGNSGSSQTFDLSAHNVFTTTLNASPTITISNPTAGCAYVFVLTQDATGSRTVTWAGTTIIWTGGTSTLSTTASAVDIINCVYLGSATKLACALNINVH